MLPDYKISGFCVNRILSIQRRTGVPRRVGVAQRKKQLRWNKMMYAALAWPGLQCGEGWRTTLMTLTHSCKCAAATVARRTKVRGEKSKSGYDSRVAASPKNSCLDRPSGNIRTIRESCCLLVLIY